MDSHILFISECAKQKTLRGLVNQDLADMTGYNERTIRNFFSPSYKHKSEKIKKSLAKVLEIEI